MSHEPDSNPLADALVAWHMSGSDGETAPALAIQGAVQLGVPLHGAVREASLARGGNGTVAQFAGGYLLAAAPDGAGLRGAEMSLCMRLRDPTGRWDAPLFARDDRGDPLAAILYGTDGVAKPLHYGSAVERGPATPYYHLFAEQGGAYRLAGSRALLEYRWRTRPAGPVIRFNESGNASDLILAEARAGVLHLGVPVALVGATAWHDVVFRFHGPNLELFVDGVLVDEEWGYGPLHRFEPPFLIGAAWDDGELATGFHGQIDHVALWDRALSDAEIAQLSGGAAAVERRAVAVLGAERQVPHYWRPRGYNVYAGDCMLLWDGARLHLFYLFDRRHHTSKWNLGAHQYAHLSSADLVNWDRHPLAIPLSHTWECAIGTGDFIHHGGRYHAFYTDCGGRCQFEDKPHRGSGVFQAVSSDGIHFRKDPTPVVATTDTGCADCSIFHDEDGGLFHLLTQERSADGTLQVAHYRSIDLAAWQRETEPFLPAGTMGPCPHLFAWSGWHYFAMANRLWRSRSLAGAWQEQTPPPLTGLNYPKTAPFTGGRLLTAGWIGHAGWGGDLLFRELVQFPDGSLGTKFPPEMLPASASRLALRPESLRGEMSWDGSRLRLAATGTQDASARIAAIPGDVRIRFRVDAAGATFGVGLADAAGHGVAVHVDPLRQRVAISGPLDRSATGGEQPALQPVAGLARAYTLDLIVIGGIVDLCVDERYTVAARRAASAGPELRFSASGGAALVTEISVCPLTNVPRTVSTLSTRTWRSL